MDLKDLYQEIILDHGKNPRNLGKFENFNKDAKGHNPLCGDKVHVYLKVDENKKISDIKFEGHGCAISMASASIMTELMKGKDQKEVNELIEDFLKMIKDNPDLESNLISEDDKTDPLFFGLPISLTELFFLKISSPYFVNSLSCSSIFSIPSLFMKLIDSPKAITCAVAIVPASYLLGRSPKVIPSFFTSPIIPPPPW